MEGRKLGKGVEDANETLSGMPSFIPSLASAQPVDAEGNNVHASRVSEHGALDQSSGFRVNYIVNSTRNPLFSKFGGQTIASDSFQFGAFNKGAASADPTPESRIGSVTVAQKKGQIISAVPLVSGQFENWGESAMADNSPRTDTSTDVDTDDRNLRFDKGQATGVPASDSSDRSKGKAGDQKTLRRLAQNREAARKSRLRKKAYVQQLENSRLKLTQIEQELQRARQQGIFISSSGDQSHSVGGNACA